MRLNQVFLLLLAVVTSYAQTYKFEAATIKPSKAADMNNRLGPGPQGGLRAENVTVGQLIAFAYGVRPFQIVGAPKWVQTDRYDVLATPERPEESPSPGMPRDKLESFRTRLGQRVQSLLAERFGAVIRAETREMPLYSLVVRKEGHKLTKSEDGKPPNMSTGRSAMTGASANMRMVANGLSGVLQRPVVDDTGLAGLYDLKMEWTPDSQEGEPPVAEGGG